MTTWSTTPHVPYSQIPVTDSLILATGSTTARTLADRFTDVVNVKDYGVVGDGATDDRANLALAVIASRGKTLYLPEGQYLVNTDGGTITLEEVTLRGPGVKDGATAALDQGAVFRFTGTTNAPFKVRRGVSFIDLGFFYPNQTDSATPTVYPPTLDFDFTNGAVQFVIIDRCVAYNAYRFCLINNAAGNVGHCWFTDNTIYGIHRCFEITHNLETLHFRGNDFTFGHWLAATEAGSRAYTRLNGYAIQYDRGDGIFFNDNLIYGYLRGLSMGAGGMVVQLCRFHGNAFDNVRFPYYCTGAGNFYGLKMLGNDHNIVNTQDTTLDGNMLFMDNTGATIDTISLVGEDILICTADAIKVSGNTPTRFISVLGGMWRGFGNYKAAGNYDAMNVTGSLTNLIVTGTYIRGQYNAFTNGFGGSPNTIKVTGVTVEGCQTMFRSLATNTLTHTGNTALATQGTTTDTFGAVTTNWPSGNFYDKASGASTRPSFLATTATATSFAGAAADCPFATEVFDLGSNYATPSFTAPRTGKYRLEVRLTHNTAVVALDRYTITIVTTARSYSMTYVAPAANFDTVAFSVLADMSVTHTAKVQVQRDSGTGAFTLHTDGTANSFSGHLVE